MADKLVELFISILDLVFSTLGNVKVLAVVTGVIVLACLFVWLNNKLKEG